MQAGVAEVMESGPGGVPASPERPRLTFPADVAALLRDAYAGAGTVLEFGSGGSTVLAAEQPGTAVWSVESDPDRAAGMTRWFAAHPPAGKVVLHHVDIGPTRAWGRPSGARHAAGWPRYATSVWDLPGFRHPDVILVDGRFRLACALVAALKVERPAVLLFDDYVNRPQCHPLERLVRPARTCGRMAVFELSPISLPRDLIGLFAQSLTTPD